MANKFEQFKGPEKGIESDREKKEKTVEAVRAELAFFKEELEAAEKLGPERTLEVKRKSAGLIGTTVLAALLAMGIPEKSLAQARVSIPVDHRAEQIYSGIEQGIELIEYQKLQKNLEELRIQKEAVRKDYEKGLITKEDQDKFLKKISAKEQRLIAEFDKKQKKRFQREKAVSAVIGLIKLGRGRF